MIGLLKLKKSVRDILVGVTGASIAQALSFLLVPIVARLFSPEDYGGAAAFLAVLVLLSPVSSMRYEQAILLPRQEEKAFTLSCISLRILAGVAALSFLVIFITMILPLESVAQYDLMLWLVMLPLFLFITGVANILLSWSTRLGLFSNIAAADITMPLGTSGTRIGIGLIFGSSVLGLLLGTMTGYIARVYMLWKDLKGREGFEQNACRQSIDTTRQVMSEYRDFPFYFAPTDLIREFKENIPLFAVIMIFSAQAAGFYAMASRLLRIPVTIVSLPIRRVYMQRAAQSINKGISFQRLFLKATGLLFCLGLFPFILLAIYGTDIFSLVLGAKWEGAGVYAEIISIWLFSIFILAPSSATFMMLRKRRTWLFFQLTGVIVSILCFLSAIYFPLSDQEVLTIFAYAQAGLNVIIFLVALRVIIQWNPVREDISVSEIKTKHT